MQTSHFYKATTWILLLFNLAILAFFFFSKPPHGPARERQNNLPNRAVDILQLDQDQNDTFLQSAEEHRKQMRVINDQQRLLLASYFKSLIDTTLHAYTDSTLLVLKELEAKKINFTYQHFEEIKTILKPEQEADFEAFIEHALKRILSPPKKRQDRPKDS